ncbi:tyrosine--tRNA ligase [Gimesia maris]|uniref:tyrosine--tRNA ligase n=1 Tax=Gimesia maris TaxID=122 RepID=UPI000E8AEAE6|nr:tyrosine--tRNA ligase [Gimesia maris]HAW26892.1 tyrosine--tRNA ligase [Planctomycetaceae bacterium]|tara:strand:+ start:2913 stop:4136 length:1224 start_codon:yes stop_codon:yes gene_type:complete
MQFLPVEEQLAILRRGVEKIVPEQELAEKLKWSRETGTPLRVKYGIDPTGIDLHLGHTVPMRKMRQFQELGHQAVIIIGNYTALVGDPSGRDETRARLTAEQVEANAVDYLNQVGKVIDLENAEVVRNGDWFSKMNFAAILELCSKVTVAQLLTRDDFSKRYREEAAIYLHECLYPIMQAWDSVEIKADIELGGTEQLYSFMLARDLQKDQGLRQQVSVMSPILVGTDGVRRMGKSLGNYIGISESPYEMMKKFMQLSDDSMQMFYELLTDFPLDEVQTILAGHPKEAKVKLAKTIITEYHAAAAADEAADRWQREIGSGGLPEDIPVAKISRSELNEDGTLPAANLLKQLGLCASTSDARRSIQQGGAKMGEEKVKIETHDQAIAVESGMLLWVGKKRFCQVELLD